MLFLCFQTSANTCKPKQQSVSFLNTEAMRIQRLLGRPRNISPVRGWTSYTTGKRMGKTAHLGGRAIHTGHLLQNSDPHLLFTRYKTTPSYPSSSKDVLGVHSPPLRCPPRIKHSSSHRRRHLASGGPAFFPESQQ